MEPLQIIHIIGVLISFWLIVKDKDDFNTPKLWVFAFAFSFCAWPGVLVIKLIQSKLK